jgi:hypothetical protein
MKSGDLFGFTRIVYRTDNPPEGRFRPLRSLRAYSYPIYLIELLFSAGVGKLE